MAYPKIVYGAQQSTNPNTHQPASSVERYLEFRCCSCSAACAGIHAALQRAPIRTNPRPAGAAEVCARGNFAVEEAAGKLPGFLRITSPAASLTVSEAAATG